MYQGNNPQEYEDLGYQYWKKGNVEEALAIFREGVQRYPDQLNLSLCLGFCLLDMDEYVDARRVFETVLNSAPGQDDALMGMGKIFLTMSKFENAEQHFLKILKANPDSEALHLEVARAYYEANSPEDALGYYKLATRLNPDSEEGWFGLGVCYHLLGRIDSAKYYIQRAMEGNDTSFRNEALCYYGHLMYDEDRHDEALRYFEQIPIEKLNDLTSLKRMVKIYQDRGRADEDLSSIFAKIASLERLHKRRNPLYNIAIKEKNGSMPEPVTYRCRQKELFDSDVFTCGDCPNKQKRQQQRKIVVGNELIGYWMTCELTIGECQAMGAGNNPERGRYMKKIT